MRIQRLTPPHAAAYRRLMLEGYRSEPAAFTATVAEREGLPLDWWLPRVSDHPDADQLVFGAFVEDQLAGVAGLRFEKQVRTRHKATLFGMFVLQTFAGRGIGKSLVQRAIEHAGSSPGTRIVQLTVTESNTRALRFYESCGFRSFGVEPFANRVGDEFLAKVHMWRPVGVETADGSDSQGKG